MKFIFACWLILLVGGIMAQNPPAAPPSSKRAAIEGMVTRDPDSEPVKKALIELIAENQVEGGNYTATTGPDGTFRVENILPGRYHLFAERSGFLETDKNHGRSDGRVLTLTAGQLLKDLRIRLQAARPSEAARLQTRKIELPRSNVTDMPIDPFRLGDGLETIAASPQRDMTTTQSLDGWC